MKITLPAYKECCVCGQHHDCDQYVKTRLKTELFFSTECYMKEVRKNQRIEELRRTKNENLHN